MVFVRSLAQLHSKGSRNFNFYLVWQIQRMAGGGEGNPFSQAGGLAERPKGKGYIGKQKQTRRPKQKAKKRVKKKKGGGDVIGKASSRKPISDRERQWEAPIWKSGNKTYKFPHFRKAQGRRETERGRGRTSKNFARSLECEGLHQLAA